MSKKKKWSILNNTVTRKDTSPDEVIEILLANRGIKSGKERALFVNPTLDAVTPDTVGIDSKQLTKALKRIKTAIEKQEQIIVFGDYDVDGITGCAILWETIFALGGNVLPFIPDRKEEGYGLSIKAMDNAAFKEKKPKLIITVDNGIVANEAVHYANEQNIDVIITDHHTVGEELPDALAIVHTTNLCGAGVGYLLSLALRKYVKKAIVEAGADNDVHLELAALGTVADLVPLVGANRVIVKEGLKKLQTTQRIGLVAMFQQAGITQEKIGVYDIGYIIGPRLNASGRIGSAMDSLRLLCTQSEKRASLLASKLEFTNRERQQLLKDASEHAITFFDSIVDKKKIIVIAHESYQEGIIGLVAGRLVEAFYRPAIVLSIGTEKSKASARSVTGFNIIEFLRLHQEHFINVGGHPMAAGFTIETQKLGVLQSALEENAEGIVDDEMLTRTVKIDCEIPFTLISPELYKKTQQLAPFGMGNPEPIFMTRKAIIKGNRVLGKEGKHLRLLLEEGGKSFEAIGFGFGEVADVFPTGSIVDIVYTIDENTWQGNTKIQLRIRDITQS